MPRPLLAALAACCLVASAARADVPYWQERGTFSPFVRAIAVDPTDPNIVYVGASNAATYYGEWGTLEGTGVFRSTDGGAHWTAASNGLGNLFVTALVIDPSAPNVVYAGLDGKGVYKSIDSGGSWSAMNAGLTNLDVYALAIDPTNPSNLYAGCDGGGLFRLVAGTWTAASGLSGATVHVIAIDPVTPSTIYAGTGGGVAKSTNGGASFALTGPLTVPPPGGIPNAPVEVRALAIDASNPSTILAGAQQGGGVFRSTDGGATWTHSSTGLLSEYGNWRFMTALAQDPTSPAVFYAASTRGTYRSHDGGVSWAVFNAGLSRPECEAFGVHAGGTVYTGSVFGEFHRLAVRPSGVNHFRCFKASSKDFEKQSVTLTDRFGVANTVAARVTRYCTPTDPMGEGIVDPTSHLLCYKIGNAGFQRTLLGFLTQRIDGYRGFDAQKSSMLCLPATVGAPAAAPRDAYRCLEGPHYKSNDIDVSIADALGSQLIRKHTTNFMCAPADLDGNGENIVESGVDLRCDRPKSKGTLNATTIVATDRYGTHTVRLSKTEGHCYPALESRQ